MQGKSVLVVLADHHYINQAKQLFSSAYWKAGWKGDYLLLGHEMDEHDFLWFRQKGIHVKRCDPLIGSNFKRGDRILASKCYLFSEDFKVWDNVVYLDTDILIRAPIHDLAKVKGFYACHSMWQTLKDNITNLSLMDVRLSKEFNEFYDLKKEAFNAGVLAFSTDIIQENTFINLVEYLKKYLPISLYGDQLPLNLFFYNQWKKLAPIYNRILEVGDSLSDGTNLINAILIHFVGFGEGPWNTSNTFHTEWTESLAKAEQIDLSKIPNPRPWSSFEIEKCSRIIVRQRALHLDTFGNHNIRKSIVQAMELFLKDPCGGLNKIKEISRSLTRSGW